MTRRFCNRLQGRCLRVAENDAHIYICDIPLIIKTGLSWSMSQNHFDKNIFATDCLAHDEFKQWPTCACHAHHPVFHDVEGFRFPETIAG